LKNFQRIVDKVEWNGPPFMLFWEANMKKIKKLKKKQTNKQAKSNQISKTNYQLIEKK